MVSGSLKKRIGRFTIHREDLLDNQDLTFLIMSNVIVIRAELLAVNDTFEYFAYSPLFAKLPEGSIAPTYQFVFERDKDGILFLKEAV